MAEQDRAPRSSGFKVWADLSDLFLLVALTIGIFVVMAILLPRQFLNFYNLQSMMFTAPELGVLAIAMMISMIPGGIDLSLVSIANFSAIVAGMFFHAVAGKFGGAASGLGLGTTFLGLAIAIAVGAVAGALNGTLITRFGITPLLATIGTSQALFGASLVLTGGPAIEGFPSAWQYVGQDAIFGLPAPMAVMILVFAGAALLLRRTAAGFSLPQIGTNAKAAMFSGIRTDRILFATFVVTGVAASIAGVLLSARTNAAKADYGGSYLLVSVLVAVLGGADPGGGRVRILGVAAALAALTLLSSGFQMMRFSNFLVELIWGAFLIGVLTVQRFRKIGPRQTR